MASDREPWSIARNVLGYGRDDGMRIDPDVVTPERAARRRTISRMTLPDLRLCCVVELDGLAGDGRLTASLGEAHRAGATCVLLSLGRMSARAAAAEVKAAKATLDAKLPLLLLARPDIAIAAGLDGVHLQRDDLHPNDARRLLDTRAAIGVSIGSTAEADELYRLRVDYACIGDLEASGAGLPDPGAVGRIAFRIRLAAPGTPVIAAATLDPAEGARLIGAGADGLAPRWRTGPEKAAGRLQDLRAAIDHALALRGQI